MPVYNGASFLAEAIDSILGQSYADFELIIINDGSQDESADIIKSYADPRIRYIEQENRGLAATLNRAAALARAPYLARQDQDDISHRERLARQVAFLDAHPSCGLVGSWALILGEKRDGSRAHRHAADPVVLKFQLLFNNPFVHSSVLIRKSVFDTVGGYSTDPSRQPPEDYELWSRMARSSGVANIPEILLTYREVPTSMSRKGINPFLEKIVTISSENLAIFLDTRQDDPSANNLAALVHGAYHRLSGKVDAGRMTRELLLATERYCRACGVPSAELLEQAGAVCHSCLYHYRVHRYGRLYGWVAAVACRLKGIVS